MLKSKGAALFTPRITTDSIDPVTIQVWLREPMTLSEWTEVFRLTEQRFSRQKKSPGETVKTSQKYLERDKFSQLMCFFTKRLSIKKEEPELPTRYRQKNHNESRPDAMSNQEIISVLVNMDHNIALLDQGVCDLVKTYERIMKVMVASNDSLDEKISIINTVIGNKPPGLAETYESPDIWMTIAAMTSQMEEKANDMEFRISKAFSTEKDRLKSEIVTNTTTFLEARLTTSELGLK